MGNEQTSTHNVVRHVFENLHLSDDAFAGSKECAILKLYLQTFSERVDEELITFVKNFLNGSPSLRSQNETEGYRQLGQAFRWMRTYHLQRLLTSMIPPEMIEEHHLLDNVDDARDFYTTIKSASKHTDDRCAYALCRDLLLARSALVLTHGDHSRWIQSEAGSPDQSRLDSAFVRELLSSSPITSKPLMKSDECLSLHAQERPNRTVGVYGTWNQHFVRPPFGTFQGFFTPDVTPIQLDVSKDQRIPALFVYRRKQVLETILKGFELGKRKLGRQLDLVYDRFAMSFLFRTPDELATCAPLVFGTLNCDGREQKAGVQVNPRSSPHLRIFKDHGSFDGQSFEVQCLLAKHFFDGLYATGPEVHALYRIRQYTALEGPLEWMFPLRYFGVDWSDPAIQKRLSEHAMSLRKPLSVTCKDPAPLFPCSIEVPVNSNFEGV